jgi:cytochrome c oxidase subunit 7c
MLSRAAVPAARQIVARRGFQTTRAQLSSPYHYPEGPYSNLPFNPKTKYFALRFWGFMAVGFGAPFGIAGRWSLSWGSVVCLVDADRVSDI